MACPKTKTANRWELSKSGKRLNSSRSTYLSYSNTLHKAGIIKEFFHQLMFKTGTVWALHPFCFKNSSEFTAFRVSHSSRPQMLVSSALAPKTAIVITSFLGKSNLSQTCSNNQIQLQINLLAILPRILKFIKKNLRTWPIVIL